MSSMSKVFKGPEGVSKAHQQIFSNKAGTLAQQFAQMHHVAKFQANQRNASAIGNKRERQNTFTFNMGSMP